MLVKLGDGSVQYIRDELPPRGFYLSGQVLVTLVPVLGHDVLAVHGVVVTFPGLDIPGQVLQFVPVGGQNSLEWVSHYHKSDATENKFSYVSYDETCIFT